MKLGVHVSSAGKVDLAIDRAISLGCNTFQIFVSNPRGWRPTLISDDDAKNFRNKYQKENIQEAVAHAIYLINMASPNDYLREQSVESLISGLLNVEKLGLSGLVTHIGSHQGDGVEKGISRVVECLNQILENTNGKAMLLLENTAGAGNLVGKTLAEIGEIIRTVNSDRLGFCLDTAHAFEFGYELNTASGLENLVNEIENEIGLDKLCAIHLNDSMTDLGSNRDRHETYGKGMIGEEALTRIINHPKLRDKPFIMETPEINKGESGKEIVDYVRSLWR
jgi:deoxyribonuclease IV